MLFPPIAICCCFQAFTFCSMLLAALLRQRQLSRLALPPAAASLPSAPRAALPAQAAPAFRAELSLPRCFCLLRYYTAFHSFSFFRHLRPSSRPGLPAAARDRMFFFDVAAGAAA